MSELTHVRDVIPDALAALLLPLEQLAGADPKDIAEDIKGLKPNALQSPTRVHHVVGVGHGDPAAARLRELVRRLHAARGHELGESESHIKHGTNVIPLSTIRNDSNAIDPIAISSYLAACLRWEKWRMATVSRRVRDAVFLRDGYRCVYCRRSWREVLLTVDHIRPRSCGGSNLIDNLAACCATCNSQKGARWE